MLAGEAVQKKRRRTTNYPLEFKRGLAQQACDWNDRLNGIAPVAWLRHVLTQIADHPVNRVDDFLPWNCAARLAG